MKIKKKHIVLGVALMVLPVAILLAQDNGSLIGNPPPLPSHSPSPQAKPYITTQEFTLSCLIIFFSIVVLILEFSIIKMKILESQQALKLITITLVIVSSLFLVTAGFSAEYISPVIGLLGTIIGYLLGNNAFQSQSSQNNKNDNL